MNDRDDEILRLLRDVDDRARTVISGGDVYDMPMSNDLLAAIKRVTDFVEESAG